MYTIERDESFVNVWYVLDPEGSHIFRYVGNEGDLEGLLSHLNRG